MAEHTEPSIAPTRTLWLKDLMERWDISDVTLWRLRKRKKIPAPTITLGKKVGWSVKVIEMYEDGWAHKLVEAYEAGQLEQQRSSRKRAGERREAVQ